MHTSDSKSRGQILVAGEESELIHTISRYFVEQGYCVETALNRGDAAMLASLQRPDVVILDLRMPGTSGPELMTALHEVDPSIAVVVLGEVNDGPTARTLLEAGAVDYVARPFTLEQLDGVVALAVSVRQ